MKEYIRKLLRNQVLRYLFFGACTTLVNMVVFGVLRSVVRMELQVANILSILCAILFAYVTNKLFVFDARDRTLGESTQEFLRFSGMRVITMTVEVLGVEILTRPLHINEYLSKLAMQFVIILLNYIISKRIVFRTKTGGEQ